MDINELKQFQIFKNLNEDEIIRFQKKMKIIKVPEDENFIVEGDIGDSIYLLLAGQVRINQALTLSMHKGGLCLLYTSPSPRDLSTSRMPSSA